jgi:hypothetical protein
MRAFWPWPGCCLLLLTLTAGQARAESPDLKKAREQFDQLTLEDAEATVDHGIRSGTNGPDDLVGFYVLEAEIAAAKGDEEGTEKAFVRALSIHPETTLPSGSAPKVAQQYASARAWIDGHGALTARVEGDPIKHLVRITVKDPLEIVASVVVIYDDDGGDKRASAAGKSPFEVKVPARERMAIRVQILDEHGNRLQELGSTKAPLEVATDGNDLIAGPGELGPTSSGRGWYARWWLWGGVAVVAGGAGTYFGLQARAAEKDAEDLVTASKTMPVPYADLQAIETRGKNDALGANIAFGAAGVCAGVALYLLLTEPDAPPSADRDTSGLTPVLGGGQLGVSYSGRF